jgi:hypothetical protein
MRLWERVASFLLGLGFGGFGVYVIFTTSNQVGSAALVIAGAAFSLIAVQGTRLVRFGSGSATVEMVQLRAAAKIIRQAEGEEDTERSEGMVEAAAIISPDLASSPSQQAMRYEARLHQALKRIGAKVQAQAVVGDRGLDFVVEDAGGRRTVIQAKYRSYGPLARSDLVDAVAQVNSLNDDLVRNAGMLLITNAPPVRCGAGVQRLTSGGD